METAHTRLSCRPTCVYCALGSASDSRATPTRASQSTDRDAVMHVTPRWWTCCQIGADSCLSCSGTQ